LGNTKKRGDYLDPIRNPKSDGSQIREYVTMYKCPTCGHVSYTDSIFVTEEDLKMAHEIIGCDVI
jgi:hypothetical protein